MFVLFMGYNCVPDFWQLLATAPSLYFLSRVIVCHTTVMTLATKDNDTVRRHYYHVATASNTVLHAAATADTVPYGLRKTCKAYVLYESGHGGGRWRENLQAWRNRRWASTSPRDNLLIERSLKRSQSQNIPFIRHACLARGIRTHTNRQY